MQCRYFFFNLSKNANAQLQQISLQTTPLVSTSLPFHLNYSSPSHLFVLFFTNPRRYSTKIAHINTNQEE
jgi:hypothetical protein